MTNMTQTKAERLNMINSLITTAKSISGDSPILIVSHQATLTGAPAVAEELGRNLAKIGIKVIFLVIETGTQISFYQKIGKVYLLEDFGDCAEAAIQEIVHEHKPCAAICNTITTTKFAQILKNESRDITCIGWIHEMPTVINSFFGGAQTANEAYTYCDKLVFGAEYVLEVFAGEYKLESSKLGVLPYIRKPPSGMSPNKANSTQGPNQVTETPCSDKFLIIGCGTAEPRKGLDIFVRIAAKILNECPKEISDKITFEWYGCPSYNDNYVDFCKLDAERLGIANQIHFKPVSPEFSKRLEEAKIFMLTSREDPYPLVILDSMAKQVPFVCFERVGGAADLAHIGAGATAPYGDEQAFTDQAINLLTNPEVRRRMGKEGFKRILKVNNWTNVISIFLGHLSCNKTHHQEDFENLRQESLANINIRNQARVQTGRLEKILVISFGPPPLPDIDAVEGGGLRCWNLAKGIYEAGGNADVTLTYPEWYDKQGTPTTHQGVNLQRWHDANEIITQTNSFDTIIISFCYGDYSLKVSEALRPGQRLVLDCYVPIHVEMCARRSQDRDGESAAYEIERERWEKVLTKGDLYLCSNENQLHYYRGILYQIGRLNPKNYENDPLVIAPFGIASEPALQKSAPIQEVGVSPPLKRLLWFGGVYPWFNIECLFEAICILNSTTPCALVVVGVRNPFNGHPDFVRLADQVERLAESERYKGIIFLADWVKYQDRADWYLDSDLTVMVSADGVENEYAWRTRLVDYLWSDVHVATSGQDLLSKQMVELGLASKLELGDANTIAESLRLALEGSIVERRRDLKTRDELRNLLNIANIGKTILNALQLNSGA